MNSILTSIKKMLGIAEECTNFDIDLIIHINSVLAILTQLGVGPERGFSISGKNETWGNYIGDQHLLDLAKSYMFLKIKLLFDPPASGALIDAINKEIIQCEWRLTVAVDEIKALN